MGNTWKDAFMALKPRRPQPAVRLYDVSEQEQTAVQWQVLKLGNAYIVNAYNASNDPKTVKVSAAATDVLSGAKLALAQVIKLEPMEVRLFRCVP